MIFQSIAKLSLKEAKSKRAQKEAKIPLFPFKKIGLFLILSAILVESRYTTKEGVKT